MMHRWGIRAFAGMAIFMVLVSLALPRGLRAQEAANGAKSGGSAAPAAKGEANVTTAAQAHSAADDNTFALVKEYAVVNAVRPILMEKVDLAKDGFTREWYRVEWRTGDPFYLFVIRPRGVEKPPVILYLPSFPQDMELFQKNEWDEAAVRGGYAVVGFIGNVTGHRTRYRVLKEWFVSEMPEALTSTTHDVQMILDWLSTRGDLDMNRVGMFGNGSGAAIAVLASVVDSRIQVLDLQAPWGDWKDWLAGTVVIPENERATYTKPEFEAKVAPLDPVKWLPRVQAKSVRIEDIRGNKAMPDAAQEKLEQAAPDFVLINQYGNGRAFLAAQHKYSLVEWEKSQLTPDAKPAGAMEKSARVHFFPAMNPPAPANLPTGGPAPAAAAKAPTVAQQDGKAKDSPR
jgi:hypothetical protein